MGFDIICGLCGCPLYNWTQTPCWLRFFKKNCKVAYKNLDLSVVDYFYRNLKVADILRFDYKAIDYLVFNNLLVGHETYKDDCADCIFISKQLEKKCNWMNKCIYIYINFSGSFVNKNVTIGYNGESQDGRYDGGTIIGSYGNGYIIHKACYKVAINYGYRKREIAKVSYGIRNIHLLKTYMLKSLTDNILICYLFIIQNF